MRTQFLLFVLISAFAASLWTCRKDSFSDDPSALLDFSQDTVYFDTVFTTIGSVTQLVRVFNRNENAVRISNVSLEGGTDSQYRINLDGISSDEFNNVEISAGDSIWMFVEVTIDPSQENLPFIVEDRVRFELNGNEQFVHLSAWGQNAYYHGQPNQLTVLSCDEVWNADLPHLVYGVVAVDEGCNLTINPGTQVHCHQGAGIYVAKGTLTVNGQLNNEVVFQGDRLDQGYEDLPGQWGIELSFEYESDFGVQEATVARGGLWLYETVNSTINYAIIKNGNIGIQVDTVGSGIDDALVLTNTKIDNMGVMGILGQGAHISGYNNLITDCGQYCAAFTIGGRYRFEHCTFANYWTEGNRQTPAFALNNYYYDVNQNLQVRPLTDTWFYNCIMWGNNAALSNFNEFVVDLQDEPLQEYRFEYCAIDTQEDISDFEHYNEMVVGVSPPFVAPDLNDFHLGSNPISTWYGLPGLPGAVSPTVDLDGNLRFAPVILGCYEEQ